MSIRVTTSRHIISPPPELTKTLSDISVAGGLAKSLGEERLYNDLKTAYNNLKNHWESSADEMCKKKSKTNWLGGGEIYIYHKCLDWDWSVNNVLLVAKNYSREEKIKELNHFISKLNKR